MTAQRHDFLFVDGERHPITAAAPMPFSPAEYHLRLYGLLSTNCYRNFWAHYEVVDRSFRVKELQLAVHPDDLPSLVNRKLFELSPNEIVGNSVVYWDIPLAYSGSLVIRISRVGAADMHEQITFRSGQLIQRERRHLNELPDGFMPSSYWVDFGFIFWILPDDLQSELHS